MDRTTRRVDHDRDRKYPPGSHVRVAEWRPWGSRSGQFHSRGRQTMIVNNYIDYEFERELKSSGFAAVSWSDRKTDSGKRRSSSAQRRNVGACRRMCTAYQNSRV